MAWLVAPARLAAAQISDPAGDVGGRCFDVTHLEWDIVGSQVVVRFTFAEDLLQEGWLADVLVSLAIDADRDLQTGFKNAGGLHSRGGADYSIDLSMSYGWNVAQLCYYRHRWDPPFQLLDKVLVSLGDPWEPNGSVLIVGANPAYGTDNHQVLLAVPTNFFTNAAFPVCGDTLSLCINDLFPCPLAVTNDLRRPLLRGVAMSLQGGDLDLVPDEGLFDTASGGVLPDYPTGGEDLVASVPDPAGDCISGTGINGEDFTLLRVFQHPAGVLSFELTLDSYWFEDTALYALLLDLDDNPDTGERIQNGTGVLGVDLIAEFSNFDNPIGFPSVLEGRLLFWKNGAYCPLNHIYHLGTGLYGAPGHVYITLPSEFTAPGMTGNRSGKIKMLAGALSPDVINFFFEDVVPQDGVLEVPLRCLRLERLEKLAGDRMAVEFSSTATAPLTFHLEHAPTVGGPWHSEDADISFLDGGRWKAIVHSPSNLFTGFYRVHASASPSAP